MNLSSLTAISPIDGRYRSQVKDLSQFFSEFGLIRYRVLVEVEYFIALSHEGLFPALTDSQIANLRLIYENFNEEQAQSIKAKEAVTNHDVKAVEYFLKDELEKLGLSSLSEWIHFGLTSQDINNTAIPLMWKQAIENLYMPSLTNMILQLKSLAQQWKTIPMLARTHGQPATPTTVGKELMVFVERLENQVNAFHQIPYAAKFGGATGNLNAHHIAYPEKDWISFANHFVDKYLGLNRMQFTTQIEHYDSLAAHFDTCKRINNILIDFSRDIWIYISQEYFNQKTKKDEVGSSAMPHKVNPIDFENAEGNLGIANALFEHFSAKLPISRLQRDLSDSTVLRNLGVPLAHSLIAINSLEKGMKKLLLNLARIEEDLNKNWAVIAEAIQTILRRENYHKPYEALKDLTRGHQNITAEIMHDFIKNLQVSEEVKAELLQITPLNYVGLIAPF